MSRINHKANSLKLHNDVKKEFVTNNNLTYIDLFAGCGGLSLGLHKAGWQGFFAIEKSKDAFATLKYNLIDNIEHFHWPEWLPLSNLDINDVLLHYKEKLEKLKGTITLIAGGPPCQGFSYAGRRDENDKRNQLVDSYIEFVSLVKPQFVMFENVKGFTSEFKKKKASSTKNYLLYVQSELQKLGYDLAWQMTNLWEFGVPQRRTRFILIGSLNKKPDLFFQILHSKKTTFLKRKGLKNNNNLDEAISDLLRTHGEKQSPDSLHFKAGVYSQINSSFQSYCRKGFRYKGKIADSHRFPNHSTETEEKFQRIILSDNKNKFIRGNQRAEFKIKKRAVFLLDENELCPTLTSNPDDFIHYCEPRILTVREYARIQTFPDWYKIKGKYTTGGKVRVKEVPRYTQLANAIPPIFSEQVGLALKEML